jgi:Tfp pilus assembly protein PilP
MIILKLILILSVGAMAASEDKVKNFFKDKSRIDKPFELRDPFKAPTFKSEKKSNRFQVGSKGSYTNISEEKVKSISEIKLVGVLIGKERRAMVSNGKSVIVLREGAPIGQDGAELKAILPGGIIIVEKMINVYGQEEYLETVIPISR